MHIITIFLFLIFFFKFSTCRDFYVGMFKKNDLLVAQDILNKERVPFRFSFADYGRKFHCPITYIRVEDRLNVGRGPRVQVIRGGLRRKILVLRLTSPYNHPISVNIYVGCQNNNKFTNPPWTIVHGGLVNYTTNAANSTDATTPEGSHSSKVETDAPATDGTPSGDKTPATDAATAAATNAPA